MKAASLALAALFVEGASCAFAAQSGLMLTSPDIGEERMVANEQVYNDFGCTGGNVSPALSWSGAPANTKSFALTVFDPDAPTGSGWWHWVVVDIPANTTQLPKGWGKVGNAQLM